MVLTLMAFDPAIFFAALGITTLEMVEASAVGLALYGESRRPAAFLYVGLGVTVVFVPMFAIGAAFSQLPFLDVKLIGGVLLLYFGQRLIKSARRSVLNARRNKVSTDHFEKGVLSTGFSVGAIEAFEAAIVLVGLLPYNFQSTVAGMGSAIIVVVTATYALKNQVRKVKQANMKVVVSALLLSFPTLWLVSEVLLYSGLLYVPLSRQLTESQTLLSTLTTPANLQNLLFLPIFFVYVFVVYRFANRPTPQAARASTAEGPAVA
jgi:uncharacterized membrane protein